VIISSYLASKEDLTGIKIFAKNKNDSNRESVRGKKATT
jgi:hypothetical protein